MSEQGQYTKDLRGVNDRLLAIERRLDELANNPLINIVKVYAEPIRPRDGDLAYPDGVKWNPGSGKGIYSFDGSSSAWVQVVAL